MNLLRRIVCAIVGHKWHVMWDTYYVDDRHSLDFYFRTCFRCRRTDYDRPTSPASPDRDGE